MQDVAANSCSFGFVLVSVGASRLSIVNYANGLCLLFYLLLAPKANLVDTHLSRHSMCNEIVHTMNE